MTDATAYRATKCEARVHGQFRSSPCDKQANHLIGGLHVCGIHARMANRWEREGRLQSMADFWWKQP